MEANKARPSPSDRDRSSSVDKDKRKQQYLWRYKYGRCTSLWNIISSPYSHKHNNTSSSATPAVSWYHHHWYSTPLLHRDSQSWTRLMCMESFSFRQRFPCGWPPLLLFIGYATICEYWVGSNAPPLTLFIHSRSQWVVICLHGCYWSL